MSNRAIIILNSRNTDIVNKNLKNLYDKISDCFKVVISEKFNTISKAINVGIKQVKEKNPDVEFIHIFHDDVIVNESYDIEQYEKFMTEFKLGFYTNCSLCPLNYVYNNVAPRLVIMSQKYSDSTINVFPFDSREYMIINCKINNEIFNEDIKYLYNIEYLYRCNKNGSIPFLNFYFDSAKFIGDIVRDDNSFSRKSINQEDYIKEEQYLLNTLGVAWIPHSNADDVINYFRKVKGV